MGILRNDHEGPHSDHTFPDSAAGEILELIVFVLEDEKYGPKLLEQLIKGNVTFSWWWAIELYDVAEEIFWVTGREPSPGRRPWCDDDLC
jgi:hypothetical protein